MSRVGKHPVEIPAGVTVSNHFVPIGFARIGAFNKAGLNVGTFVLHSTDNLWTVDYVYVHEGFSITGRTEQGLGFNCHFEKGWNRRYYTSHRYTTQKPEGVVFEWRYEEFPGPR